MSDWKNETEAREQIKSLVAEYYEKYKKPEQEKEFVPGDRLSYASRVYDEKARAVETASSRSQKKELI